MSALLLVLADGITIKIGNNVWSFGLNLLLYLLIAALVGLVAEFIVGWRLPFGIIGAIIAALVGMWLMTQVITIAGVGDFNLFGISLLRSFIGAIVLVAIWHLITFGLFRRHYRSYSSV